SPPPFHFYSVVLHRALHSFPTRRSSDLLVMRPHGGQTDWNTFLHELGHALHFAYMRPDLPYEYRWLGDNSVTEGYAMLFDHLMQDRKSTRLNSSHSQISYAVFCLKKKKN